jgi:energy-coupling factor transporter ATP-binding protein EcfA2
MSTIDIELVRQVEPETQAQPIPDGGGIDGGSGRRNAADRLIDYVLSDPEFLMFFNDQHGLPHALVGGQPIPLGSRCYDWLARLMWEHEMTSVGGEALARAAQTLRSLAKYSSEVRELHTRSAWHDDILFVELDAMKVLRVDANGWRLDAKPPVLFRRFPNLKPLPTPQGGGNLDSLLEILPLRSGRDERLLLTYATCGLLPHIARPILLTTGAMGSGKSTLHRIIKRLIDPTTPETIRLDPRDALQKASHCAVVLCDNLSHLSYWQVDSLCRWVTGEGDSKRVLYTDDDDFIVELKRLVLLNGVNPPADRSDFLDRCLCLELERIPDNKRKTEREIWATFDREHAKWLGCIFDLLSAAMRIKDGLRLPSLPRLADWGEWAAAVYEAAGWGAAAFIEDWSRNVTAQQSSVLEGSTLAQVLLGFMSDRTEWAGTASELLNALTDAADAAKVNISRDKSFPKAAHVLTRRLRELQPMLTAQGCEVSISRTMKGSQVTLVKKSLQTDETPSTKKVPIKQQTNLDNIETTNKNGELF